MPEELRELIQALNSIQVARRPRDPANEIDRDGFDTLAAYHRELADAYETYEQELIDYESQALASKQRRNEIHKEIEDLIIDMTLDHSLPDHVKQKTFAYAWEESHSSGYEEVYNTMEELGDLVENAFYAGRSQKDPAAEL